MLAFKMKVIRSKRRTISIIVDKKGQVTVKAPSFATDKQIKGFIYEKKSWIEKKQGEAKEREKRENPYRIIEDGKVEVLWDLGFINIKKGDILPSEEYLVKYLKEKAREIISLRISILSKKMDLEPTSLRITSAKTRWGSCNGQNGVNFTYRLMFAPIEVIDYVIIHEMCHIVFKDHSKNFWNLVSKNCPHYKEYRKWLRLNNNIMDEEF